MMMFFMVLVGEIVFKDRMGSVMGLLGSMFVVGIVLGFFFGGVFIVWVNWCMLFLVMVLLGMGVMLLVLCYLFVYVVIIWI